MSNVSVIIVNYNAGNILNEAVKLLLCSIHIAKVIVVDNGSTDQSMVPIEHLADSQSRILIIYNKANLGFAKACNIGIAADGESEYLLFLNPDCLTNKEAIGFLLACMESSSQAGMAGPLLLNPDETEQAGGRRTIPTPWRSFVRIFGFLSLRERYPRLFTDFLLHQQPLPDFPIEIEAISGSCMLVRRAALLDVGPLDEGYFMHCEDLDWFMRFRQRGWKILFVPEARVFHYKGTCSKTRPVFVEWHKHKGMVRFYRKFLRHQYPTSLMWMVTSGVWLRFGLIAAYHIARNVGNKLGFRGTDSTIFITTDSTSEGDGIQQKQVGVIGATSLVGDSLLPMMKQAGWRVLAYSRSMSRRVADGVIWQKLPTPSRSSLSKVERGVSHWICVAPIWVLSEYFNLLEAHGVRRVVVLSSTSRFTKNDSTDPEEQAMAFRLAEAEERIQAWAESHDIEWVVLRPTLIYDFKRDKNIVEIARFIRHFGFFPLLGNAGGLRQPIHAQDVAIACMAALQTIGTANRAYNLSGGETLSYREMVTRIFAALGRSPRFLNVPLSAFSIAVAILKHLPRYRQWSATMAERMNQDMVFDHIDASRNFAFEPRPFVLSVKDVTTRETLNNLTEIG